MPWSHDIGVDNQHSRHGMMWPDREKQKWTKAPQDESPKGSESRRTKPPKMRKYFKTPTNKVYDPMITWYRCGQSTFSSCHHVAGQRKAKMDKKTIVRNPQIIRIKADKTPKMRKYFKTPTIKVYDAMITWYRCGQSTFSSCHHVAGQRKAKMDKCTIGRKPQRIRIKADKTPKNEKIFKDSNNQGVRSHDHMIQVWTINILVKPHVAGQRKAKIYKSTTGRKPQRIRIKADKTPKNEKIF